MLSTVKTGNLKGGALRRALLCLVPLLAPALSLPAAAAITQSFNYQGFLLSKATNLPVDTPQDIKFVIYNAPTGNGTVAPFIESRCNVGVSKGRYDVEIGSLTAGGVPDSLFLDNQGLWLEIQVDADGNCSGAYEAMSPRMRLQASPYAFSALYASTASAATTNFKANIIDALPVTQNGAITISTNLFVMGGISVGSISPGQTLAVAGIVESSTGGFKFPDGSIQTEAAAVTMWKVSGNNVYSINPGNLGVGEDLTAPLARLHVSTAAGDTGDIFLVTAGAVEKFKVNGLGEIYGNGSKLSGLVRQAGDTMTGHLRLEGSSLTATSPFGVEAPRLKLAGGVELSSASAVQKGGVYISSNVYLPAGAVYYGDGGGLTNLFTYDNTKVWRTGDTITGSLTLGFSTTTLTGSTLTVTGSGFSVTGSTFAIAGGSVAVGSLTSFPAKLSVVGGIIATSSITAQQGLYSNSVVNALFGNFVLGVTASSGTFQASGASQYSIETASSIKVNAGGVILAPLFIGDGSQLSGVLKSTDTSKVSKFGDTMTGSLQVWGSSVSVFGYGTHPYALTVGTFTAALTPYSLVVTTAGNVGVQIDNPAAPLEVLNKALISGQATSNLSFYTSAGDGFINWRDNMIANGLQGALGFFGGTRDLIYRAGGNTVGSGLGAEVFRITATNDDAPYWKFGIGTSNPQERFHVGVNVRVSSPTAVVPALFVSTVTGNVALSTNSITHSLTVGRGIIAGSSITAQGGFAGPVLTVSSITFIPDVGYDAVYLNSRVALGGPSFTPLNDLHIRGTLRIDQIPDSNNAATLDLFPVISGHSYIRWQEGGQPAKGVLGMRGGELDLIYVGGDTSIAYGSLLPPQGTGNGTQAFRIKPDGKFLIGDGLATFTATERFQVMTNLMVSRTNAANSILYVSTGLASVGFSTGTPKERVHVASSFLVGDDQSSAILFVSTATDSTGIGTNNPRALLDVNGNILGSGAYTGTAAPPVTGIGKRFMWVPSVAAIRAGGVAGTQWDAPGIYSVGFGYDSIAAAPYSGVLSGQENTVESSPNSVVSGGIYNLISGESSSIPGGRYNVVRSSYSFAGGYNNYLNTDAVGSFVWGYDDVGGHNSGVNKDTAYRYNNPYVFLIDPDDVKHYKVGVRTPAPQAALDVNGDAQFGAGVTKSSFTATGFFVPRGMTTAELHSAGGTPPVAGAVAYNSTIGNICFSTGTAQGQWALAGTKGNCY